MAGIKTTIQVCYLRKSWPSMKHAFTVAASVASDQKHFDFCNYNVRPKRSKALLFGKTRPGKEFAMCCCLELFSE